MAEFASEEEISRFFAQGQSLATPTSGWQAIGSSQSRMDQSQSFPSRASEPNQWNSGELHGSSLWSRSYSSTLWGNPSSADPGRINSPSPISSFLPVDHLTGGGDSLWTSSQSNRLSKSDKNKTQKNVVLNAMALVGLFLTSYSTKRGLPCGIQVTFSAHMSTLF